MLLSPYPSNFAWLLFLLKLLLCYTENWSLNPSSHQKNCDANPNNAFIHCISYPLTTISIILLYNGISSQCNGATFISFHSLNGHSIRKFLCNIHDGIICITWHDLTLGIDKEKIVAMQWITSPLLYLFFLFFPIKGFNFYLNVFLSFKS